MKKHGSLHAQQLAENMKASVRGVVPVENTEAAVMSIEGI